MSKLSGAVLIVAGVGVAAYALAWPSGPSVEAARPAQKEAVQQEQTNEKAKAGAPSAPAVQKTTTAAAPVVPPAVDAAPVTSLVPAAPPSAPAPKVAVPQVAKPTPAQTESVVQAAPKLAPKQPIATAGPPLDRVTLTRELQRQLKRVGCYEGEVNGVWTPVVRRSMKAFTDRVNATLPVDQPDYILLAMVQSHQEQACGRACPNGQGMTEDRRCLPIGVIAAASKKRVVDSAHGAAKVSPPAAKQPTAIGSAAAGNTATPSESLPPVLGRMALAGPKQEVDQPPAKRQTGAPSLAPQPGAGEKHEGRPHRQARRARYAHDGRLREFRRADQQRFRSPSWNPWSRPWMFN